MPALDCTTLIAYLTQIFFASSAMHRHVGNVGAEAMDPCFAPWGWREGELCGTPETTASTVALMTATAPPQPRIIEDYSYLWDKIEVKTAWRKLQVDLATFRKTVDERNIRRKRTFATFQADKIETAVSS